MNNFCKIFIIIIIYPLCAFLFLNTLAAEENDRKENLYAKAEDLKNRDLKGMVFVKGGCFQMGDTFGDGYNGEKPVHEVCVNDFYIGETEVTQGEWVAIMESNPSVYKNGDDYPVDSVDWKDLQEFLKKLNEKTGRNYRLPTEAEWEYAARSGGREDKFAGTNNESELGEYAWYSMNSENETHAVKQKKPNAIGLYDMAGNVWEWVADLYDGNYYDSSPKDNPTGPVHGMYHVVRGGSWFSIAKNIRSTDRYWSDVGSGSDTLFGFRLALSSQ